MQNPLSSSLLPSNMTIKIYRTVILLIMYGCEAWSVTLREEHSLRVFENRVLKRTFEPKRDEVTWEWRRLYKEELYDLYSSLNFIRAIKSRRMRWAGLVACMGNRRGAYRVLVGRRELKRPLWRPGHRWEDNIKIDVEEVGWGGMNGLDLAEDKDRWWALVNVVLNLLVP